MDTALIDQMTPFARFIYFFGAISFASLFSIAFSILLYKIDPPPGDGGWMNEDGGDE